MMMNKSLWFWFFLSLPYFLPAQPLPGDLYREYVWLPPANQGEDFLRVGGNLDYGKDPAFLGDIWQGDGYLRIPDKFDLSRAIRAEVSIEWVQSHDDTKGLAIQIGGHDWLEIPPMPHLPQPQANYMLHTVSTVNIPLVQLRGGDLNVFRLRVAAEQRWRWPQHLIYGLVFRVYYQAEKQALKLPVISSLTNGGVVVEKQEITLADPSDAIVSVDYLGEYMDTNWEGDGQYRQWHDLTHKGALQHHIGSSTERPFTVTWDTEWIPDQSMPMAVTARLQWKNGLYSMLPAISGLNLQRFHRIELCQPYQIPANWSTREDSFASKFAIHGDLRKAEAWQIAWRSWSPCYANGVSVNRFFLPTLEGDCYQFQEHQYEFSDCNMLLQGENVIRTGLTPLQNGQMVHGMEVQYPGPMVKVRFRNQAQSLITETMYEGKPHFVVHTPTTTYWYDQKGGGFSRLIDIEGYDWISFQREPWGQYPASAASAFRGIPNVVYGSPEGGAGHPGHAQCESRLVGDNQIISTSLTGDWEWKWTFFEDHVLFEMLSIPAKQSYWFLYEGTPGGRFKPSDQYFITPLQGRDEQAYDFYQGDKAFGKWDWFFMGDKAVQRGLLFEQSPSDTLTDSFAYLGNTAEGTVSPNGMVVLGFGRADAAVPLLKKPMQFRLGMVELAPVEPITEKQIRKRLKQWRKTEN